MILFLTVCLWLGALTTGVHAIRVSGRRVSAVPILFLAAAGYGLALPSLSDPVDRRWVVTTELDGYYVYTSAVAAVFWLFIYIGWSGRSDRTSQWQQTPWLRRHQLDWIILASVAVSLGLLGALTAVRGLPGRGLGLENDFRSGAGVSFFLLGAPQYLASSSLYGMRRAAVPLTRAVCSATFSIALLYIVASGVRYLAVVYLGAFFLSRRWSKQSDSPDLPVGRLVPLVLGVLALVAAVGMLRSSLGPDPGPGFVDSALIAADMTPASVAGIKTADEDGHLWGSSYLFIVRQVVPSSLQGGRPDPPIRSYIGRFSDPRAGLAFPTWIEAYANFGLAGVAAVGVGLGTVCKRAESAWARNREDWPGLDVLAALSYPYVIQVASRGYLVAILWGGFWILAIPALLVRCDRRPQPRRSELRPLGAKALERGTADPGRVSVR